MADPPRPQQRESPARRDTMFCHECHDEWYRDEHGLTCPDCGSDFTEIIEDDNDPRDHHMADAGESSDDGTDSLPGLEDAPPHQHALHNHSRWGDNDDPEEGDISNLQWRQVGPGRFAVTGTMYRTFSPADLNSGGGGMGAGPMGGFAAMLNSIIGGARIQPQGQDDGQQERQSQDESGENTQSRGPSNSGSGTTPGGHRFTYTAGARLFPRDANHPGPRLEPVDELNNVLVGLMAAFGEGPGGHNHPAHNHGSTNEDGQPRGPPLNPLMALFSQMMAGNGQIGDAVYSQEALDRIISQLMEQNASSNAPGPASQADIDSLPRKPVTIDMLGTEGKAECSICMDEVNIGEEVTELPCHHWFHHPCVSAWLTEHDTCPHCRKGITKQPEGNEAQNNATRSHATPSSNPSRMPGSFDSPADGTPEHPFVVRDDSPAQHATNVDAQQSQETDTADNGSAGGIGDRLRRGLFGPPT